MVKTISRTFARVALLGVVGLAAMGGCVGHNIYPPEPGERGFTNVNSDPFPPIMTEALKWVALRYPPNEHAEWNQPAAGNVGVTPFAVNLPRGLNAAISNRIVANIGMGALPMTPENQGLPTYHVSRIWVQGDDARVDIVRPVLNVAFDASGTPVTQGVTLRLRGGVGAWRVTSHRLWSFNSLQPPALNYVPGTMPAEAAPAAPVAE
jgi:hypothetical protein